MIPNLDAVYEAPSALRTGDAADGEEPREESNMRSFRTFGTLGVCAAALVTSVNVRGVFWSRAG